MRIVSWNIQAGGGRRSEAIAARLRDWQADVAVLSEFRATPPSRSLADQLARDGLTHQRCSADPKRAAANALLVASRWPLRRIRVRVEPDEPLRWLLVRLSAPVPLTIGALHVPNRDSGRKYPFHDALLGLAGRWRGGPALIVGDTNSGLPELDEETPVFGPREARFMNGMQQAGWSDAFRRLHPRGRAYTWYSPNGRNGFRLDQGFFNCALWPRLRSIEHVWAHDKARLSDHAALLLELRD